MGDFMSEDRMRAVTDAAADIAGALPGFKPRALVVLGSGLGAVVDALDRRAEVPFADVRGMAASAVAGHSGRFVMAYAGDVPVLVSVGRLHLYEGHPSDTVVLPLRAARAMGASVLVATNAAGGVSDRVRPGDLVMLSDHLNLTGSSPLLGPNLESLGERFPGMADAYSARLRTLASERAGELGLELVEGVYAGVLGPQYETPAEVRALAAAGADVVGMSTVHEVIAAAHAGMECLAFSAVTNMAGTAGGHEEVLETGARTAERLSVLLTDILARL